MEFVASGVYEMKDKKLILFMGNALHPMSLKNEFLNQYTKKGEAMHTETGEVLDLFEHTELKTVVAITRGISKTVKNEILAVYQEVQSKKIFASPIDFFEKEELVRRG